MTRDEKRLIAVFRELPPDRAALLLDFSEFLHAKTVAEVPAVPAVVVPRPENESVVRAIKRLAASYPMLDKGKMFSETSSLMTQHVMQGRPAAEVIDELEALFLRHYEALRERP